MSNSLRRAFQPDSMRIIYLTPSSHIIVAYKSVNLTPRQDYCIVLLYFSVNLPYVRQSRMFMCCYVDYRVRLYDCEELMGITVPQEFTHLKEVLSFNGEIREYSDWYPKAQSSRTMAMDRRG